MGSVDPFVVSLPEVPGRVVVEVPHAGLLLPEPVRLQTRVKPEETVRDSDPYVDRLVMGAPERGAALLTATVSRYVVDLNRAPDDVSTEVVADHPAAKPTQPRGVVWSTTTEGRALWNGPLTFRELSARIARYHRPYHLALEELIETTRARHGPMILLCVHSMPSTARAGRRADVVPGTRGRSTASSRVIDAVDAHFRSKNLSVRHDEPYRGGYTTGLWGRPDEGIHAVQIELSRALYLDEQTLTPNERGVAELQDVLDGLVTTLVALDLS
jgi:N-formylglutamate amidohydrolase